MLDLWQATHIHEYHIYGLDIENVKLLFLDIVNYWIANTPSKKQAFTPTRLVYCWLVYSVYHVCGSQCDNCSSRIPGVLNNQQQHQHGEHLPLPPLLMGCSYITFVKHVCWLLLAVICLSLVTSRHWQTYAIMRSINDPFTVVGYHSMFLLFSPRLATVSVLADCDCWLFSVTSVYPRPLTHYHYPSLIMIYSPDQVPFSISW